MPEEQMIKDMYNLMQQVNSSMTAFDGRMGCVERKVDLLTVKTENLEEKTDMIVQDVQRLDEKTDGLSQDIQRLDEKTDRMESSIQELNERTSALEEKTDQLDQTTKFLSEQNSLLLQRTDILTEKSNLMSEKIDFISEKTNSIESRLERTEGEVSDLKTKMEAGFSDIHMILENEICTKLNVLFENREDSSRYKKTGCFGDRCRSVKKDSHKSQCKIKQNILRRRSRFFLLFSVQKQGRFFHLLRVF